MTILLILLNSHDGGRYHIETSPLICKSMDWFLYDNGRRHESLKGYLKMWVKQIIHSKITLQYPNEHSLIMKETDSKGVNKYLNNLDMEKTNDIYGTSPKDRCI